MREPGVQDVRHVDEPQPGFFELRLVRGGPKVAGQIVLQDGRWHAVINGERQGEPVADPLCSRAVMKLWHHARPIDEAAYRYLLAKKDWAEQHQPDHPAARPNRPIQLTAMRSLF